MVDRRRRHTTALLALALSLVGAPSAAAARRATPPAPGPATEADADPFDPHRPGRTLDGRTFHVPQGQRLAWEAWEGEVAGGGRIEAVEVDGPELLTVSRVGVDTPADRLAGGVALVRYAVAVHPDAPPDSILGVRVRGRAASGPVGVEAAHDWTFAFTLHVVPKGRYLGVDES